MKQIATANGDFNISGEIQIFSYALSAGPDSYALKGEVRLGDGAKDIAGGGAYTIRATLGGVTVFRSDMVVLAGVTRRIFDFECWGRAGETLAVLATGLAADVDVDVTTYLYTGVNVVEISEDEIAADVLESLLDGTGGAVLMAAQLKLACDVDFEGALDCRNVAEWGSGQYNTGPDTGQYNIGGHEGQNNSGTNIGQFNHGDFEGQYNYASDANGEGQYNVGGMVGQRNRGPEAVRNQGNGVTPKALTLIGAADVIDDILADTADMQPRFAGITVLANWLRGMFRKSAMDATAKGEANTGGGTFDEATDSQEALRDTEPMGTPMRGTDSAALASVCTENRLARLDATVGSRATQTSVDALPASIWNRLTGALTTAGSIGAWLLARIGAVKAKTDTIGAADLTAVSPVLEDGDLEIVQSDDYMEADGRALEWTDTAYTGPIQDGDDAEFALMETADYHAAGGTPALTKAGTAHLVGTTLRIVVELTAAETAALEPSPPDDRMNYTYQVRVDIGSSGSGERQVTAALGSATVKKKVVA